MKLSEYLNRQNSLSVADLCFLIGAKSEAQIRQWQHGYANRVPGPIYAAAIERATNGLVTRRDLRPQDWHLIWPELAENEAFTPSLPSSSLSGPLAGVQEGVGVRG